MAVRLFDHGRLLYGGSPPRLLKLTRSGRHAARRLLDRTSSVENTPTDSQRRLRNRLIATGIMPPVPPRADSGPNYCVVIPHYHDPEGAVRTVRSLAACDSLIVVDDGSSPAAQAELRLALTPHTNVTLIGLPMNRGPGAARNAGAASADADADVIVFVDSGVLVAKSSLDQLAGWLADDDGSSLIRPLASAPRVAATPASTALARYETGHSPLDVAPSGTTEPMLVGPGRHVSYVPSAVLAVRRDVLERLEGFDESMRFGEDVDLIWRISATGGFTVLDPAVVASHPARSSLRLFAAQRFAYGSSAAPLAIRHGDAAAPVAAKVSVAAASLVWLAAPLPTGLGTIAAALGLDAWRVGGRLADAADGYPGAFAHGAMESFRLDLASLASIGRALLRTWWPLAAVLLMQPFSVRLRRRVLSVLMTVVAGRCRSDSPPAVLISLVDDLAYGAGVWRGAVASRSMAAIAPRLVRER